MTKMGDAVHETIAWPIDKLRLPNPHSPTESNKKSNQSSSICYVSRNDILMNVFDIFGFRVVTAVVVATKVVNRSALSWTVITQDKELH
ncbi:hypothetical protein Bca101_027055 [Brassica carinata]